ncbi:MAG: sodium:proton antiporter [Candidatus Riflebacteria bacterium HGW-Riflebacteria-1]|jgi:Kef-type K+ transport system membrane component KefB|nr:MAG: sodium:proton antiporter [Candidatus Riflebacteria bacterium HGW-Riflebacteria-1]
MSEFSLPLNNPVLIFSLLLFIILATPIIFNRLKIPHLIGMIIAGAIVGPHGMNLMLRDSSIVLFGTVGLLYIMFLAGLEIDMADFKKNSNRSIVFGLYTFSIPMLLGILAGYYFLGFSMPTSILLASMFASHTLIAYPLVSTLGVSKNRAVTMTIGGTLITDTLALLVLAAIVGTQTGHISEGFWLKMGLSFTAIALTIVFVFPVIGRWFFKNFNNHISQYNFVLGMVFLASFMVELAGVEAIIGAFLAGLALNRLIPRTSPLMNRIEFVGNALFIPIFLIGVGMLIDFRAFFKDFATIKVALTMTIVATFAKYMAAWLTQKTFGFSRDERCLIFGLSNAQAAATLAAVLVGYNVILGQTPEGAPIRLLSESILNGTILMILVTCTIASFAAQKGAENIALDENLEEKSSRATTEEHILIPIGNQESAEELVNLSVTIKSKSNTSGLYALTVIDHTSSDELAERDANKILDLAKKAAAATDTRLKRLLRYDLNIVNAITGIVRQHKITDLILGLHHQKNLSESFLGNITEGILSRCNTTTMIYRPVQPLSTIKRDIIIVPQNAEREIGFPFWMTKIWNIGRNTGSKLVFYAPAKTNEYLREIHRRFPIEAEFIEFSEWDDFLILSRDFQPDDNLIIILSRKGHLSYNSSMARIPQYLNKYFVKNNFILVFPMQIGIGFHSEYDMSNPSFLEPIMENFERLDELGKTIVKLFSKIERHK